MITAKDTSMYWAQTKKECLKNIAMLEYLEIFRYNEYLNAFRYIGIKKDERLAGGYFDALRRGFKTHIDILEYFYNVYRDYYNEASSYAMRMLKSDREAGNGS